MTEAAKPAHAIRSISPPLEFWATVQRESERAERYDMRLSMVVYELGIKDERSLVVRKLVRLLYQRVRNMDLIGWFDSGQLAVLLPHTVNGNAMKVARDLYYLMSPITSPPPFTIYTYPSDRWPIRRRFSLSLVRLAHYLRALVHPQGITQRQELRAHLELEMDRSNRYGHVFSILIFHGAAVQGYGGALARLARALNSRLRETDVFGWYDAEDIAAILPYASYENAGLVGDAICRMIPIASEGSYDVYTYPARWFIQDPSVGLGQGVRRRPPEEGLAVPSPGDPVVEAAGGGAEAPVAAAALAVVDGEYGLQGKEEFFLGLRAEMQRARRNQQMFSLLIFHLTALLAQGGSLDLLNRAIADRRREIDACGWFGKGDIAWLLPFASYHDSLRIGRGICEALRLPAQDLFSVYSYPEQWGVLENMVAADLVTSPEVAGQGSAAGGRRATDAAATTLAAAPSARVEDGRQGDRLADASAVEAVEEFIAHPLPVWKRVLDVVGAVVGLLVLSPLFLLAAAGIQVTSPGPVLFRQTRIGYKRKPFIMFKFRTMHLGSDAESHRKFMKNIIAARTDDPHTKLATDERIFPFGLFLRKTSIDELPQLFNVLKGEMSLVGPRPCLDYEAEEYLQWHSRRFCIVPGLTGLWQVSGKNRLSFKQMIRLDIQYAKKFSFWFDLRIILKTFPALVSIFCEKHT